MRVINADPLMAGAVMFGESNAGVKAHIEERLQQYGQVMQQVGGQMLESFNNMYDRFNGADAVRKIEAMRNIAVSYFTEDRIRPLTSIGAIQCAKPVMQEYIVAHPETTNLIIEEKIGSYGLYDNMSPDQIRQGAFDTYKRATHGMLVKDGDTMSYKSHNYKVDPDAVELTLTNRADIMRTYRLLDEHYESEFDEAIASPTSSFNDLIS